MLSMFTEAYRAVPVSIALGSPTAAGPDSRFDSIPILAKGGSGHRISIVAQLQQPELETATALLLGAP
jgi:hypothetical protein